MRLLLTTALAASLVIAPASSIAATPISEMRSGAQMHDASAIEGDDNTTLYIIGGVALLILLIVLLGDGDDDEDDLTISP